MVGAGTTSTERTFVSFLRAVNVAGHATVTNAALSEAFAAASCRHVRTIIQSGNVVFECDPERRDQTFERIRARLRTLLGGEPGIAFRTAREIERLVRRAPFEAYAHDRAVKLYVAFLSGRPLRRPTLPLADAKEAIEAIGIAGRDVFLVSRRKPNGMYGFPNALVERATGAAATTRNWSTIGRIAAQLAAEPEAGNDEVPG